MRQTVGCNIRAACASINNNSKRNAEVPLVLDVGSLANDIAEVARMCHIPDNEVHHESVGTFRGSYGCHNSQIFPDCSTFGPPCIKQAQHRYSYHIGQHSHQVVSSRSSSKASSPTYQQQAMLQQELQQHLLEHKVLDGSLPHVAGFEGYLQQFSCDGGSGDGSSSSDGIHLVSMASCSEGCSSMVSHGAAQTGSQGNTPTYGAGQSEGVSPFA